MAHFFYFSRSFILPQIHEIATSMTLNLTSNEQRTSSLIIKMTYVTSSLDHKNDICNVSVNSKRYHPPPGQPRGI